ncbi:hypothetical protein [Acinetobacter gerneri]|uniref:Uncharacterized protein n=1 Tax=Acinetobacter gerneri DSM 14967 = CIP 107464 = MTCC 9824 TaxID=1120926 RepID=N8YBC4_9GAMM|nr:hypothetical protein [Acinetobacter gerneri]ENV33951.1 hypothetical protein F960_01957 [Acinetobacter gerneri DSM 14967 = CIP 107464 = MTCC 9824]EPR82828.1 hypothetical protein L289_2746 [Acinetobacter gerneri DSM 14967 = CIP 107464 = MTCC 9824]MDV2438674.1 hypothetical protein [Acinetobacter gerneri]
MGICVSRNINGISINASEYLLDDDDNVKKFLDEDIAKKYLIDQGFNDEDIYWMKFEAI